MGNTLFSSQCDLTQSIQSHEQWIHNKPFIVSCTLIPMNLNGVSIEDGIMKRFNPYRTEVLFEVAKHLTDYLSAKSAYVVDDAIWFVSSADDKYKLDTELITSHISSMATTLFYHYSPEEQEDLMVYFETEIISSNNNNNLIEFLGSETKKYLHLRTTTYDKQSNDWYKKQKGIWSDEEKERIRNMYLFGYVIKRKFPTKQYVHLSMNSPLDEEQNIQSILFSRFIEDDLEISSSDDNDSEWDGEGEGESEGESESEDIEIEIEKVE